MNESNLAFLTSSSNVIKTEDYKIIAKVLTRMDRCGVLALGAGFCISTSDMIRTALLQEGIKTRLVECKLTINNKGKMSFIGFEDILNPGEVDTHVVVITETKIPILIDGSISHRVRNVIIDEIIQYPNFENNIIADLNFEDADIRLTYQEKLNPRVPVLHQNSILNRIEMDDRIFRSISLLKKLNYIGIGLSLFAVIAVVNQIFRWFV